MNIFVLDQDPILAAQYLCDKHIPKMLLESAQLLCSPFQPGTAPYKRTHYNHPCAKWTRSSYDNYYWLLEHASAINIEFETRFNKYHKSYRTIIWCWNNFRNLDLPKIGLTPFAQAMPVEYKNYDFIQAYRNYYKNEKSKFAKWDKTRSEPAWWQQN